MESLNILLEEKLKLVESLKEIDKKIEKEQSKIIAECSSCHIKHIIGNLTYIRTHWYTHPSGCTDGDYWNEGEGNFKCPSCNHVNRLTSEYEKLKKSFLKVVDTYER